MLLAWLHNTLQLQQRTSSSDMLLVTYIDQQVKEDYPFGVLVPLSLRRYVLSRQSSQYDEIGETLGAVRGCTDVAKTLDPLERVAVTLAFGYLVQHDDSPLHQPPPEVSKRSQAATPA